MNIDACRDALSSANGWRKSSYSNQNGCVELNNTVPGYVGMRDSKLGQESPVLVFKPEEIRAFVLGVKNGEFDSLIV